MGTLKFGDGTASTHIPDGWLSKVDRSGATVAAPSGQDAAFLWLSTISWKTPDRTGFNPAEDFLGRADSPRPLSVEDQGKAVIVYSVEQGAKLESHHFRVLPKKPFGARCISAFLTLSVKRDAKGSPLTQQAIDQAWEIARKVRFNDEQADQP